VTHNDSEGRRGRRDNDGDWKRRVIELRPNSDHCAGDEEPDGGRNGHHPDPPDDVRERTDDRHKEDEAHRGTIRQSG